MGVHVGPGVLGLALLQQDVGGHLVDVRDQLEHGVLGQVFEGKLPLARVTWVSLPQYGMAIAGYNLPKVKPDKVIPLSGSQNAYSIKALRAGL